MIRACLPAVILLATAALAALPQIARAQVYRCTAPDGTSIYTDRECSELGAMERLPRDGERGREGSQRRHAYRGGCARSIHQLIREMTAAIDARDVNRLAGVYHWPGMSNRAGYSLMDRLDRIVQDPVLDIVAVRAAEPVVATQRPGLSATFASTVPRPRVTPPEPARGPPVALRVHQSVGQGAAPSRTIFSLRQHLGCWWVSL